jgi:L-seryl-tRNA(Ser) seleniumtransferase/D-glucosaminate-6-phosphate ammonia-lyase
MADNVYERLGLRSVINASGKMTSLGGSVLSPSVAQGMRLASQGHVDMDELMTRVGQLVAEATGAEAAWPTSGAAAGIALSVAAVIAGTDAYRIGLLPEASFTSRREVVLQAGHQVNFGASVAQMIRLGGGLPVVVGSVNATSTGQLRGAIGPNTVLVLYVQSHHAEQRGMVSLGDVVEIARERSAAVLVDAAAEEDLRVYLGAGADLVTYSGGKAIGGPTSGFVAGRRDLVEAVRAQGRGIGRPMKVSKEQLVGFAVALEEYLQLDSTAIARRNDRAVRLAELLQNVPDLSVGLARDEAGRDITRVSLRPTVGSRVSASALAARLAAGNPSIRSRAHDAGLGVIYLDPREMAPGAEALIVTRLREIMASVG